MGMSVSPWVEAVELKRDAQGRSKVGRCRLNLSNPR